MTPLIEANDVHFRYGTAGRRANAPWTLSGINLAIRAGETLGIVGESGSGKSTLIRILCALIPFARGDVSFDGRPLHDWLKHDPCGFRTANQIIFQNPRRSLDPRMVVGHSMSQPIRALERRRPSTGELGRGLERVGLAADLLDRYPHQLSGGQLQRVAVARALSVNPRVLYADEPTSALDVSVQAQALNLLMDLREELGLALVMVTHNLAVVARVSENLLVLRRGEVIETGPTAHVLTRPTDPYTAKLVAAASEVSLEGGGRPMGGGTNLGAAV